MRRRASLTLTDAPRSLVMVMLVASAARADSGLEVSVSVAPEAPCVSVESLSAQLVKEGLIVTHSGGLDADVSATSQGVRLRARRQDDGRLLVRAIRAHAGECDGVERALVMLIREWARAPRLVTGFSSPDAGAPARKSVAPVRPRETEEEPVALRLDAGASFEEHAPVVEEADAGVVIAPPAEPIDAGVPVAVVTPPPPTPAVAEVRWQVKLAVAGGLSALTTPGVVPAGELVLDVGREAFGGSLDATIEGEAVLRGAPGQVTASLQWLTLAARWRFEWLERLSLDVGLGVRGSRVVAVASGFTTNETRSLLSAGPAVMGTLWVWLFGPVQLMVRASAALRLPADSLVVAGGGPVFSISAAQLGAVAGLGVAWP